MSLEPKPYLKEISLDRASCPEVVEYPFNIPALQGLDRLSFHPDVTFLVGENGSGKSTLLEAIALALGFGPEGGTRNARFVTADTTSSLHAHLRLTKSYRMPREHYFLRAESFFNVSTYIDRINRESGHFEISMHTYSHGESFLKLLSEKLRGNGLYLFDEPEAALSPTRQLAALGFIDQLVKKGSQFIIATHSPILLAYPRARILQLDATGIQRVAYEDTEHFVVTRDFLNHYPDRLDIILRDDQEDLPGL